MPPTPRPLTGKRSQCAGCDQLFNSDSVFERHRVGAYGNPSRPRRCLTEEEMRKRGFTVSRYGYWVRRARDAGTVRPTRPVSGLPRPLGRPGGEALLEASQCQRPSRVLRPPPVTTTPALAGALAP